MMNNKGVGEAILLPFTDKCLDIPTTTFKIIPDYTVNNSNNEAISNAIASMYLSPRERISFSKGTYSTPKQVYYDILFQSKNQAKFYLTVDNDYSTLIESKMKTIWNKAEISTTTRDNLNKFNLNNTEVCELILKDYNFKSLSVGKNHLYPLTNMFSVLRSLKEGEQVRVNIVIEPIKRSNWFNICKDEFESHKTGKIVNNEMSSKEKLAKLGFIGAESALEIFIEYKLLLFESIMGIVTSDKEEKKQSLDIKIDSIEAVKESFKYNGLKPSTLEKMKSEGFKVKISILSESPDMNRAKLNMLSVVSAYKDLNEDNELVLKPLSENEKKTLFNDVMDLHVNPSKKCILSDKEVGKLIQLPQKDLQNEYEIQRIDTREENVPQELQGGPVRIGIAEKQGKKIIATWSQNKNVMALGKCFVGPQNSGKTTALKRTGKDCYKAGFSNIVIDFIESCETAREIAAVIPEKDRVIINLGNEDFIPAMAFNEVSSLITEDMNPWKRVKYANLIAEQVEYLINAVVDGGTGELTAPMLRYLHSACMVTFIRPGAKIGDAFEILRRWDKRNEAIRYAKYSGCFEEDDDIFFDLNELHKRDSKDKIIGTRDDLIVGITNRIIILQKNPYMKRMLKVDIDMEQNFSKYIEEGKSIFIMIPQNEFPNVMIRDVLVTYYASRVWLTVQMRENNKDARLCNIIFDEVHQVPTTARFLSNHVTEFRRHRLSLILSCHYLKQMKELLIALKSSGVSYVLLQGTEKENLEMLKEEIAPFTLEESMSMGEHKALCVINYGNQYAKFIASLPEK